MLTFEGPHRKAAGHQSGLMIRGLDLGLCDGLGYVDNCIVGHFTEQWGM